MNESYLKLSSDGKTLLGIDETMHNKIKTISIPNNIIYIDDSAFDDCEVLSFIEVEEGNPNYSSEEGVLFNKDKTKLVLYPNGNTRTEYTIPNCVKHIEDFAFYYCTYLTTIIIPNSVTTIGDYAFGFCDALTSITFPNSVTSIGQTAFDFCCALKHIYVPRGQRERFLRRDGLCNLADIIEEVQDSSDSHESNDQHKACSSCGKTFSSDFAFCPYCGAAQSRKCPVCGATNLPIDACFCPECGTKL